MSFHNKSFQLPRGAGCLTEGELGHDSSSRLEQKRSHQWFMDTTGPELFSNKKQATDVGSDRLFLGSSIMNVSAWQNSASVQSLSGQSSDSLFVPGTVQPVHVVDRNFPPTFGLNTDLGRNALRDQYHGNCQMDLSITHSTEDPSGCISYGGIRKVKVNHVRDSSSGISAGKGLFSSGGDNSAIAIGASHSTSANGTISLASTYNGSDNASPGFSSFSKSDGSFAAMGQSFDKDGRGFMSVGHNDHKRDHNILSIGQSCGESDANDIGVGSFESADTLSNSKGLENLFSMAPAYDKANMGFISMGTSSSKGDNLSVSSGPSHDKVDSNPIMMPLSCHSHDKGDPRNLCMDHNYYKGDSNTISFGGLHDEPETHPPNNIISGYGMSMGNQNSFQALEIQGQKDLLQSNVDSNITNAPKADTKPHAAPKNKDSKACKKASGNTFPSNVKSLLSTGMFDGVGVKYVSWSREKSLKATIKGTGYQCGCMECNFSKILNAYELERHANCKTKHPNNHIYFDNGKTVYAVVQELKSTPQELLFDVIQNVTGSQINQKNFRSWRASYEAAARELQRIYGKDEIFIPS